MHTDDIIEYNQIRKKLNGAVIISLLIILSFIMALYFFYFGFGNRSFIEGTIFEYIIIFFRENLANYTLMGVFLLALFGSLFFVPLPMEILFASYISKNPNTAMVFLMYLLGIFIGYTFNLFIGYKFSFIAKKLISIKKFYQIKVWINKYGKFAVFLSNALITPSQQISLIVGVFKYNKYKFWIQFLSGQLIKMIVIVIFVLIFKKI